MYVCLYGYVRVSVCIRVCMRVGGFGEEYRFKVLLGGLELD